MTYTFTDSESTLLSVLTIPTAPLDLKMELLRKHFAGATVEDVLRLLAEFTTLAASVEKNNRAALERALTADHSIAKEYVGRMNLPSLMGALKGSQMAVECGKKMCGDCAFRLGSIPNQCLSTLCDAEEQRESGGMFDCHVNKGNECGGFAKSLRKGLVAA